MIALEALRWSASSQRMSGTPGWPDILGVKASVLPENALDGWLELTTTCRTLQKVLAAHLHRHGGQGRPRVPVCILTAAECSAFTKAFRSFEKSCCRTAWLPPSFYDTESKTWPSRKNSRTLPLQSSSGCAGRAWSPDGSYLAMGAPMEASERVYLN